MKLTSICYNKSIYGHKNIWKGLGNILLVGEGNLSFSKALLRHGLFSRSSLIYATTYESKFSWKNDTPANAWILKRNGVSILDRIDATKLERSFARDSFNTIIFQFPNVGSREPVWGKNPNHILLRRFLSSADKILRPHGKVMVTTVENDYYKGAFQYDDAAKYAGFYIDHIVPFFLRDFIGYSHVNTNDEESALEDHDKFSTRIFCR